MTDLMTGGQAVVASLVAAGVDTVFGIPGVHTLDIYDALAGQAGKIRHVVARHEQGAGFMADGYARASGKVGVALVITGPGVTNAATPIGQAYSDSSPVLLISSQNDSRFTDRDCGALHQLKDQLAVTSGMTAYSRRVSTVEEIPGAIFSALDYMQLERPRPVHLEFPTDVLAHGAQVEVSPPAPARLKEPPAELVKRAARALARARRPLVWLGGGAASASRRDLLELIELLRAAVVTTCAAKGCLPHDLPCNLGNRLRYEEVRALVESSDALLVLGSELSVLDTAEGQLRFPPTLVRVDVESGRAIPGCNPNLHLEAHVVPFLQRLLPLLRELRDEPLAPGEGSARDDRGDFRSEATRLKEELAAREKSEGGVHREIIGALGTALAPHDILVCDMTMTSYLATRLYPARNPRTFLFPRGFGTLGWALPAAIGARLARPQSNVAVVAGDGGFMFSLQDLATAVQLRMPLAVILTNNEKYGVVARSQMNRFGRELGVDITNPDFLALARAFGTYARRVDDPGQELGPALREAWAGDRPTILEVSVPY